MLEAQMDAVYSPSEAIVARIIEGELIIVPLESGVADSDDELFTLNDTGRAIWEQMDGKTTVQQIIQTLATEYDAPLDVIEHDVLGLLKELLTRKIITQAS